MTTFITSCDMTSYYKDCNITTTYCTLVHLDNSDSDPNHSTLSSLVHLTAIKIKILKLSRVLIGGVSHLETQLD